MAKAVVGGGSPLENIHTFDGLTTGDNIQSGVLVKEGTDTPLRSHTTRGLVVDLSCTTLASNRFTIATAGTALQLNNGSSFPCKFLVITALPTNTLDVAIGDSAVNAAAAGLRGYPLTPNEKVAVDIDDVAKVYLDVLGDGHGVTWLAGY